VGEEASVTIPVKRNRGQGPGGDRSSSLESSTDRLAAIGATPWQVAYRQLIRFAQARDSQELDAFARSIGKALRTIRNEAWKQKRHPRPAEHDSSLTNWAEVESGEILGDPKLESAIIELAKAAQSNPLLNDEKNHPAAFKVRGQILALLKVLIYRRKPPV
jgi:hypothetical protein